MARSVSQARPDVQVLRAGRWAPFYAAITHAVLSGPAIKRIGESPIEEMIVTDTISLRQEAKDSGGLHVVSVAKLLGEAIRRITNEESVSSLFV